MLGPGTSPIRRIADIRARTLCAIADVGLFEFRRQLDYKASVAGSSVADRWCPGSKVCGACGRKYDPLDLSERTWMCGHESRAVPGELGGLAQGAVGAGGVHQIVVKAAA